MDIKGAFWNLFQWLIVSGITFIGVIKFVSKWLATRIENNIAEKERKKREKEIEELKHKFNKELEDYKKEINKELEELKAINENSVYISNIQYEKEFAIYQEIWESLFECVESTLALYPIIGQYPKEEEERKKFISDKYKRWIDNYNSFLQATNKYAPFYEAKFYDKFTELLTNCRNIGTLFDLYDMEYVRTGTKEILPKEERIKVYTEVPEKINSQVDEVKKDIKHYLDNLKVRKY